MHAEKEYFLQVGESAVLKTGFINQWLLTYAGMPGDTVFSIAVSQRTGQRMLGYNLFFPVSQNQITIRNRTLLIMQVTAGELRFRIQKEPA